MQPNGTAVKPHAHRGLWSVWRDKVMIRLLDPHLINQISAGEVVERPASVLKELIENALDAGSKHITIRWRHGGQSMIEVEDDGVGIAENDMRLALARHATSKLRIQEDLSAIGTFGFRGEALAAMAAVARVCLTSRGKDQDHGWSLSVHGGQEMEFLPSNRPRGTSVHVHDLFFATPARLKFLRSESVEKQHLWDVVHKMIIAHPDVAFSVHSDSRSVEYGVGMEKRLQDIFGSSFLQNSFYVHAQRDSYGLHGWIGLPTHHRATADRQFYCVNARAVKDKFLGSALRIAFGDTMPKGRHPVGALFLTLPLSDVDVNVHPAKTEVRFLDTRFVRGFVTGVLKQEIWKNGLRASTWGDGGGPKQDAVQEPICDDVVQDKSVGFSSISSGFIPHAGHVGLPTYNPAMAREDPYFIPKSTQNPGQNSRGVRAENAPASLSVSLPISASVSAPGQVLTYSPRGQNDEPIFVDLGQAIMQIQDSYIVARVDRGLVLVDPHAAHERIVFESMKVEWANDVGHVTPFLLPPQWSLTPTEQDHMQDIREKMACLGFQYDLMPGQCRLNTVPMIFQAYQPEALVRQLVAQVHQDDSLQEAVLRWRNDMMANWACRQSIKLGQSMTIESMNILLRRLERTPHGAQCNHGRCVYRIFKADDLSRLFDR
jgi:DNA mismatch repair protein MutL